MSGWAKIFVLFVGEDIHSYKMDFGMAMFAGLGSRHFDNLARTLFDVDEAIFPQGRALHGIKQGSTGICALKGVLMLQFHTLAFAITWRLALKATEVQSGVQEQRYLRIVRHNDLCSLRKIS